MLCRHGALNFLLDFLPVLRVKRKYFTIQTLHFPSFPFVGALIHIILLTF